MAEVWWKKSGFNTQKLVEINKFLKCFVLRKKSNFAHFWNWSIDYNNFKLDISISNNKKRKPWAILFKNQSKQLRKSVLTYFFKGWPFFLHGFLPFLGLFPSQTQCSSLSSHPRIKTKPYLESLHKTVSWMSYCQYSKSSQTIALHEIKWVEMQMYPSGWALI